MSLVKRGAIDKIEGDQLLLGELCDALRKQLLQTLPKDVPPELLPQLELFNDLGGAKMLKGQICLHYRDSAGTLRMLYIVAE